MTAHLTAKNIPRDKITVKVSGTVTEIQRQDSRFVKLLEESEDFFNCHTCCFNEKYRSLLCLHEGAHAYFAKQAGATDVKFFGPTMYWDLRPQYDKPAISKACTLWDIPSINSIEDVLNIVKSFIAGYVCRREMSDTPNEEIAIETDIGGCREWFTRCVEANDARFKTALEDAEREILKDLKSTAVKQEIWAEAKRFEKEIFPAPKLTADMLRAKRLGLM